MGNKTSNIRNDKRIQQKYRELLNLGKTDMEEKEFRMFRDSMDLALERCEDMPPKLG